MFRVTTVRRILWGLNALLASALLTFIWLCFVARPKIDRLRDIDPTAIASSPPRPCPEPPSWEALIALHNPIQKPGAAAPHPFEAILIGVLPASPPMKGIAFFHSPSGQMDMMAVEGQGLLRNGKPAHECSGFTVLSVGKESAILANPQGDRFRLEVESLQVVSEGRPSSRLGEEYRPDRFRSLRLASGGNREVWGIDQNERDWAAQNWPLILEHDVQISPCAGGGLRLDALDPNSMPATRGLKVGDVLREMNGKVLSSPADLQANLSNLAISGIVLTLERAGRPLVLEYRPLPR